MENKNTDKHPKNIRVQGISMIKRIRLSKLLIGLYIIPESTNRNTIKAKMYIANIPKKAVNRSIVSHFRKKIFLEVIFTSLLLILFRIFSFIFSFLLFFLIYLFLFLFVPPLYYLVSAVCRLSHHNSYLHNRT